MVNVMQTCDATFCVPDIDHSIWGSYDSDYNTDYSFTVGEAHTFRGTDVSCKNYAVQAMFMPRLGL